MNKIPCISQTLSVDVCIFGHFGWLSSAAVYSADCRFDSGVKWWIHCHIFMQKLLFVVLKQWLTCFWSTVSQIWATWSFSIMCLCDWFKVSVPPFNCCFWGSRVWIRLIKPLLCFNTIFTHQKAMFYQHTKFRFFHCFENLQLYLHLTNL